MNNDKHSNNGSAVLVVTSRSLNVRSRQREAWFAQTSDKRYSAERTEDEGTPWIVRFGDETLAWTGSMKKAQQIVAAHAARTFALEAR